MKRTQWWIAVAGALLAACSDDAQSGRHDAATGSDAPAGSDARADGSLCGSAFELDGEYVDWDSGGSGQFLGINHATISLVGQTTSKDTETTPPNGRIQLCVHGDANIVLSLTPDPADTVSPLDPNDTNDPYPLAGSAVIAPAFLGTTVSMRNFRQKRLTSMFAQIGSPYDATKGQVLVHTNDATGVVFSLTQAHDTVQAFGSDAVWAPGSAGEYVFFPNVDLSGGSGVTLSSNDSTLSISTPITPIAGQMTYVEAGHVTAF